MDLLEMVEFRGSYAGLLISAADERSQTLLDLSAIGFSQRVISSGALNEQACV
jgi:hypothetical protein